MTSLMASETAEAPDVVANLLERNASTFEALGASLRQSATPLVITCARGSSDHAATYGKYLIETLTGVPVASAAPSVTSIYHTPMIAKGALMLAISQSGRSPDLLANVQAYRAAGAHIVALVNDTGSPLAGQADTLIPLHAGEEKSVAATKSCIAALAALAALGAAWSGDAELEGDLQGLPEQLANALSHDWTPQAVPALTAADRMLVLGRGYSFGIAQEAALKLKETCAIQAESFSSAEVRHGPQRLVGPGLPVLGFAPSDVAGADVATVMHDFAGLGATTLWTGQDGNLPASVFHPALEPLAMLTSFYRMVEALAHMRGMDPDRPANLRKVTETI